MPNWAEVVAALAAVVTALTAMWAANTWLYTIKSQRADDCLSAAHAWRTAINRCLSLKERLEGKREDAEGSGTSIGDVWSAYDRAWECWDRFNQAFVVARRYRKDLDVDEPTRMSGILFEIRDAIRYGRPAGEVVQADMVAKLKDVRMRMSIIVAGLTSKLGDEPSS
ncbi:MAG: hypothetical protein JOY94_08415 [Methylobacteriaceae bacterium]|nr:hypothetical protein [Methylobacteriaceae bacterium]